MAGVWQRAYSNNNDNVYEYLDHLEGVAWYDAPLPRRWHLCRPQTRGSFRALYSERCACGATRLGIDRFWAERNSRRREAKTGA